MFIVRCMPAAAATAKRRAEDKNGRKVEKCRQEKIELKNTIYPFLNEREKQPIII